MADESAFGGFSAPSKMPCYCYSIPARECHLGSKLAAMEGTTCSECYARKGFYMMPDTERAMSRRFAALSEALASPAHAAEWVDGISDALNARCDATLKRVAKGLPAPKRDGRYFRWHDSGDLQGVAHLRLIVAVCDATPRVSHWLPTREAGYVRQYLAEGGELPANLTVRLSVPRMDSEPAPVYRKLAAHPRIALSGVHSDAARMGEGFEECRAYRQGGACLDCRACWNPKGDVSYPLH
jgi:hypothetical protein